MNPFNNLKRKRDKFEPNFKNLRVFKVPEYCERKIRYDSVRFSQCKHFQIHILLGICIHVQTVLYRGNIQ